MPDQHYFRNLRIPSKEDPYRILVSGCLLGIKCDVEGDNYGDYPSVLKLMQLDNIKLIPFCPEEFSFGTPREMCDIYGGDGGDVLDGKAKVLTTSGIDWSEGMIKGARKMLEIARANKVEFAILMDVSAACGNHVIYDGNRYAADKKYQIGMGVSGALLHREGFKLLSWREYETLEILYSKTDPNHIPDANAKDFDQHPWYQSYFKK